MNRRRFRRAVAKLLVLCLGVLLVFWAYQLLAVRGTFAASAPASNAGGDPILVGSSGKRIAGRIYVSGNPLPSAPLIVVLHGDAPFVNPGYQYTFASHLAGLAPGFRIVALLRPGYADPYGAKSDGDRGFSIGENYTRHAIDQLASAIRLMLSRWSAPGVVLLGHSGGAALAADIAALYPGLIDHVFLIGCPCDVPAFRKHMVHLQWSPLWLLPVQSLSPIATLAQMQKGTEITAISGSADVITLPEYAEFYVADAKRRGLRASMIVFPGKGHEILTEPGVINAVAEAVDRKN